MNAISTAYFQVNPLKKDIRTSLLVLGVLVAAAGGVLVLQSLRYSAGIPALWEVGQQNWWNALSTMLMTLFIWVVVLGVVFAIRFVTLPVLKYGSEFWSAAVRGFLLGMALPYLLVLAAGIVIYIPLGLLSLLVVDVLPYASLQFAWLGAAYIVFIWIVVGMPAVLSGLLRQGKWYNKFLAVLLTFQLTLDIVQALLNGLQILLQDSVWQSSTTAILLAIFGSLLVTVAVVIISLKREPVLVIVYAITGIYVASIASGNFSERLFHWGEVPAAILTLAAPLLYVQLAKWILRRDGTALPGLTAGYAGLLAGLLVMQLLRLRISGQGWVSLLYGIIIVLGLGFALGWLAGRRLIRLLDKRFHFAPGTLQYLDTGLTTGLMAGMFLAGFLAR